jgi:hypothetical protein
MRGWFSTLIPCFSSTRELHLTDTVLAVLNNTRRPAVMVKNMTVIRTANEKFFRKFLVKGIAKNFDPVTRRASLGLVS